MQYNFVLGTGSPGGLWVSTGSNALQKVYSGSLNGNGGNDWHIGTSHPPEILLQKLILLILAGSLRLPINGNTQAITEEWRILALPSSPRS